MKGSETQSQEEKPKLIFHQSKKRKLSNKANLSPKCLKKHKPNPSSKDSHSPSAHIHKANLPSPHKHSSHTKSPQEEEEKADKISLSISLSPSSSHSHSHSIKSTAKPSENQNFPSCLRAFISENTVFFKKLKIENSIHRVRAAPKNSHGNYHNYYSIRTLPSIYTPDPRLSILSYAHFYGKQCLDIGCNDGSFTLAAAKNFNPKLIIACDIDYQLINKAIAKLNAISRQNRFRNSVQSVLDDGNYKTSAENPRGIVNGKEIGQSEVEADEEQRKLGVEKIEQAKSFMQRLRSFPKCFTISLGIGKEISQLEEPQVNCVDNPVKMSDCEEKVSENSALNKKDEEKNAFPNNVIFRQENFIADMEVFEKFDTIMCLSTSKWIHLNYGDLGIKALFFKVYDSLHNEGVFIFEPQHWKSYKKKKKISSLLAQNYKKIQFFPHMFEDFLINTIGFKLIKKVMPRNSTTQKGFSRPIFIYQRIDKINKTTG